MTESHQNKRAILIYDGSCPFCLKSIDWVKNNSLQDMFEYLPCQSKERKQRFPNIQQEVCMQAIQLVTPGNIILSGVDAIPEVLIRLKRWRVLMGIFRIPGVRWLGSYVYRWVARNRYRISCIIKL